jgi:cytochrome c-type biogenesis protein CcmH
MMRRLLILLFVIWGAGLAHAVLPEEMLKDPGQEARARDISQGLRCLVCQNQSIDDSNAPLAKDLRVIVRERISAGDNNDQVMAYVVNRYGNYVLLKPPFQLDTALLWFLPFILLIVGLGAAFFYLRQQPEPEAGDIANDILKEE